MAISERDIRPSVCVDLDGTILENSFPEFGKPIDGARESLLSIKEMGFRIRIYTCRMRNLTLYNQNVMKEEIKAVLDKNGIVFDDVVMSNEGKPFAEVYIDDKGFRLNNNWSEVVGLLEKIDVEELEERNRKLARQVEIHKVGKESKMSEDRIGELAKSLKQANDDVMKKKAELSKVMSGKNRVSIDISELDSKNQGLLLEIIAAKKRVDKIKEEIKAAVGKINSEMAKLKRRMKVLDEELAPILENVGGQLVKAQNAVVKFSPEKSKQPSYKIAFTEALTKVNASTRQVLQECLEASHGISNNLDIKIISASMRVAGNSYEDFFMGKLKKYNVDSPSELSDENKKKFFNEIESEWTAEDEKTASIKTTGSVRTAGVFDLFRKVANVIMRWVGSLKKSASELEDAVDDLVNISES